MSYTKGEWKVDGRTVYCLNDKGQNRFDLWVQPGRINGDNLKTPEGELEANARLISAAPDMYEALKLIYSEAQRFTSKELIAIGCALAKAEGK